jgi:hypothetical protein
VFGNMAYFTGRWTPVAGVYKLGHSLAQRADGGSGVSVHCSGRGSLCQTSFAHLLSSDYAGG